MILNRILPTKFLLRHFTSITPSGIPVIDLAPFYKGTDSDRLKVAKHMDEVCREIGFFTVINHGVDKTIMDTAWGATRNFFDLPLEHKNVVETVKDYPFGYSGFKGETLSRGLGNQKQLPDLKEMMCIGPVHQVPGIPSNLWPKEHLVIKDAWEAYYKQMSNLSSNILEIFALALNKPQNWFTDKIDYHGSALRALNYPHQDSPPKPGELRASAHTDYGSMTILKQDDSPGGLQVMHRSGEWVNVGYTGDSFVVNLGDLMQKWTNERWVSTLHRVVNPPVQDVSSTRRQSMAFFHNINPDHLVTVIDTCTSLECPPKFEPITAGDHLMQKHNAAMGHAPL